MLQSVKQFMQEQSMPTSGAKLVVAVSGGADSVVLLDILVKLGYQCVIAHCNFHLRGAESDADMIFVQALAKRFHLPLHIIHFDTPAIANERKISIEMAARDLRYEWFRELLKSENCCAVAIAHHANDTVETFFINLSRGTGIRGLLGIKAQNDQIIRPLLQCKRSQIEAYAHEHGLDFRTDSTNVDTLFVRNKIRQNIVPQFQAINPAFTETMCQNLEHLTDVAEIYTHAVEKARTQLFKVENEITYLFIDELKRFPAFRTILYELLQPYNFNSDTVQTIVKSLDGLSGKEFYSTTHRLIINRAKIEIETFQEADNTHHTIAFGVKKLTEPIKLEINHIKGVPEIKKNKKSAYLDADKLLFPLVLRHWEEGDTFIPFGMTQRKKVSDFFIDEKISRLMKDKLWILTSEKGIVWIVGHRIDNRFRINDDTKSTLVINFTK